MTGRSARAMLRLVDRAVRRSGGAGERQVAELRREHPEADPGQLLALLRTRYLRRVARLGGAIGAVAAVPAVGTVTAAALTAGQVTAFLDASADHVAAVATVHGVPVTEVERRRTLLLASLLGAEGARAVEGQLGLGSLYWAKAALTRLPLGTVRSVNAALTRRLVRWGLTRGGALALGRLAPFGVGAVVGYAGTRAMGTMVIEGVTEAFGPAPDRFPAGPTPLVGR